jgi:hypothetical protein
MEATMRRFRIVLREVWRLSGTEDRDGDYRSRGEAVEARCLASSAGRMRRVKIIGHLKWYPPSVNAARG